MILVELALTHWIRVVVFVVNSVSDVNDNTIIRMWYGYHDGDYH